MKKFLKRSSTKANSFHLWTTALKKIPRFGISRKLKNNSFPNSLWLHLKKHPFSGGALWNKFKLSILKNQIKKTYIKTLADLNMIRLISQIRKATPISFWQNKRWVLFSKFSAYICSTTYWSRRKLMCKVFLTRQ